MKTLMLLTNQDPLKAVFNDASKYRQAIDSGYHNGHFPRMTETMLIDNVLFFHRHLLTQCIKTEHHLLGFTKIIDNVYTGIYSHYFAETDELMRNDYMKRWMTANDSETIEKVRLVQEFVSSEKNQPALNMLVVSG